MLLFYQALRPPRGASLFAALADSPRLRHLPPAGLRGRVSTGDASLFPENHFALAHQLIVQPQPVFIGGGFEARPRRAA